MDSERLSYLPSIVRGSDDVNDMLRLAGSLHLVGYGIDVHAVNMAEAETLEYEQNAVIVDLLGYSWTYDKIPWAESRRSQSLLFRKHP